MKRSEQIWNTSKAELHGSPSFESCLALWKRSHFCPRQTHNGQEVVLLHLISKAISKHMMTKRHKRNKHHWHLVLSSFSYSHTSDVKKKETKKKNDSKGSIVPRNFDKEILFSWFVRGKTSISGQTLTNNFFISPPQVQYCKLCVI